MTSIIANNPDRFCGEMPLGNPESSGVTLNQALTGIPNRRILVKPTIVAPIAELSAWRTNPAVTMSKINTKTTKYPSLSGWVPLQPNIYTSTDVFQPINSTNGIAIVPEFPSLTVLYKTPTETVYFDTNTNEKYVTPISETKENYTSMGNNEPPSGSCCYNSSVPVMESNQEPVNYNVYDPRLTGYGSNNRDYYDSETGQTRYFYDDVNAVRMPNYLTRNKLDSCLTPYGDTYGAINSGNLSLAETKPAAEQSWIDNSLQFRDTMMRSLMRKRNEELIQTRMGPKRTYGSNRTFAY